MHHTHQRISLNHQAIAQGRLCAYNYLVNFANRLTDRIARRCRVDSPTEIEIDIPGSSKWWIVFDECRGEHRYWIALSDAGVLIDGRNDVNESLTINRIVQLSPVDDISADVVNLDCCYSSDGRLDFDTLKSFCFSLLRLCEKLELNSFFNLMMRKLEQMPIDASSLAG